jgi:hypothetical protein
MIAAATETSRPLEYDSKQERSAKGVNSDHITL